MIVRLTIPGPATGKGRPRFNGRTGRTYTPAATVAAEKDVRAVWREAGCPRLPDGEAIDATICVFIDRPASHFRKHGFLSAEGRRQPYPCRRPDLDNVAKLILDSLNGLAYRDDAQVVSLHVSRRWVTFPPVCTTLTLETYERGEQAA